MVCCHEVFQLYLFLNLDCHMNLHYSFCHVPCIASVDVFVVITEMLIIKYKSDTEV